MVPPHMAKHFQAAILTMMILFLICYDLSARQSENHLDYSIFLIGGTDYPDLAPENLQLLKKKLNEAGENSSVIFLGDNVHNPNVSPSQTSQETPAKKTLGTLLGITKDFKGRTFMIPGDLDWANGRSNGLPQILEEEKFVTNYLSNPDVFYPKNGCPGPLEFKLDEGLFLILVDIQWILHRWEKPLLGGPCETETTADVLAHIERLVKQHKQDKLVIAAHHPIYSDGKHGGRAPLKNHIFPLLDINAALYVPMPIIGSAYPLFRSTIGHIQDLSHPKYRTIRGFIAKSLKDHGNVVYASGHERSLQHIKKNNVDYIISGAGSKTAYVKGRKHSQFALSRTGFSILNFYQDGLVKVEFWTADKKAPQGEKIYAADLFKLVHKRKAPVKSQETMDFSNKTIRTVASKAYSAGKSKEFFFGKNYRDVWNTEIEVEVFDIKNEKGGLDPIKIGGGMQTKSLRLQSKADQKQYVLRSIEKYPENAIPLPLRKTFAADIVQDQISASHPYSAIVIPPLAEAAGIYHTNPKVVFIPDDPALGEYRQTFANMLALFEERPAKNWSDADFFGNSEDLINTFKVIEKLNKDNDNSVDQKFVLRSRLFDMIIGDWDRHDDQWRWATFKKGNRLVFQPIPRDRDQTFFMNEGVFPKIASRKWAIPKIEGFNKEVRWAPGLNFNARYFDRTFLSGLSEEDWVAEAENLKTNIMDSDIEKAVGLWPEKIYSLTGETTAAILKARRDKIDQYALDLYTYLAEKVDVMGSNKKELFEIEKLNNNQTQVTVRKISREGNLRQEIYNRIFNSDETQEIRIYGQGGNDEFIVKGDGKNKIKVRIISGEGDDRITDQSAKSTSKKILVYDSPETQIETQGSGIKKRLSSDPGIHEYNRLGHKYDILLPLVSFQFNPDDGFYLGGGFLYTRNGWRKKPFASKHQLSGNAAFATGAFNLKYKGAITDLIGAWDLDLLADVSSPFNVDNFFGLGNESVNDFNNRNINFYRIRNDRLFFRTAVSRNIGSFGKFSIGEQYLSVEIEEQTGKFLTESPPPGIDTDGLFDDTRRYLGTYIGFEIDNRDSKLVPTQGVYWNNELEVYNGVSSQASDFTKFSSELALYHSIEYPATLTIATRLGFAHNFGDFEFYNANVLGGKTNLRGYRRTRFYGETSFYHNFDLRLKLFSFSSYIFPGYFGISGFHDIGRVWFDGENSDKWHRSLGGGIWVSPLGAAVLSFTIGFTEEENLALISLGFLF